MAAALLIFGARLEARRTLRRGASLIELLVVLFIIGLMLSSILPALGSARAKAQATVCQNNIYQLDIALRNYIDAMKRFPQPNRWSVDVLRWVEEMNLAQAMKGNTDPNANFPRPPVFVCPFQEDFPTRVDHVGFCHFVLVVDRPIRGPVGDIRWEIQDRAQLTDEVPQEPWYIAPELSPLMRDSMFANKPGPHPGGLYMTRRGLAPN
jgi:prepilin-type N-terminal cleavage/methylation domain-containing protein